ncbi:AMP-dependent synthetase/ligase [Bradyrhizobium sediminis]|uniref:AMP-dependent synthetase/ligase n=1 Tax=Bradyrhizobium sediminis TaxID=2840469 RepID=A0A975NVU3_9BRAD|nr:AMP-dependent synthetase/ligase [Bradyrhizobium sediminis]QWG22308.1 AMP-dependent synthetase/ligase [Bradyrhizobium sediminis]
MTEQAQQPVVRDGNVVAAREAGTLWGLFCECVRRCPVGIAYRDYDPVAGNWCDHTWQAIAARVDRFRAALAQEKLEAGDRVAILLPNGIDWVCLDMAAHASGLVVVALYPHDNAASNAYILGHSGARLVLLDSDARRQSLRPFRSEFPSLERMWVRDVGAGSATPTSELIVRNLADVLANTSEPPVPHPAAPSDLASLVYTSGTTGRPKGVMLSHFAMLWNAEAAAAIIPPRRDDVFLSVLPLAHAFERTVGYYLPMMGGSTVAYARSVQDLRDDLIAVRPTAMLGVPLLYERMSAAIRANVAGSFAKRILLQIAALLGWRRFEAAQHRASPGLAARLFWPILKHYIAAPVLAAFGGRLRAAISGGAPLDQDVARLLIGLSLPLVEGYGLTEAAPVVAANGLDDNFPGSVGRPLQGIEVKLSPEGELLVRSPSMMMGYWKDPGETARALDPMGWLSTGDFAELKDGRIFVRGRLREMIVLSIGEKVNPNAVETELTRDCLFKQAVVVGDRRPFLTALIVLDPDAWRRFAADKGLDPERPNHAASKTELLARVTPLLATQPRYAQVRAVHLILESWTIEAGLLTPTLKVKRDVVQKMFAREINALYAEPPQSRPRPY